MYLRSCQKTEHALKFNYNKDINNVPDLFTNMVLVPSESHTPIKMSNGATKSFKVNHGGNTYYVCDDTTCN